MTYLSWILWGLFGLIILLTIFGLLAGLCKGLVKTTVKTVLKAILITVYVFTAPMIAKVIGNLNISNFSQQITIANQVVPVTTITETLANVLTATGFVSPMNGIAIYETAFSFAYSILSYAVFLVLMILTQLLISLVTCIIYNVFVRWLVPTQSKKEAKQEKSFRKENKSLFILVRGLLGKHKYVKPHRTSGAILGAAQEFVFACILMMPITSISRIAISSTKAKVDSNSGTKNASQGDLTNNYGSLYQAMVMSGIVKDEDRPSGDTSSTFYRTDWDKYIDQIENSLVYKMLGFGNMDKVVMDKVSVTTVNGKTMPLSDLVTGTFDVAYPLLNSKSFEFDSATTTITINYSTLLATTTIDNVLSNFLSNQIMMSLLPPLIDTALNYASANTNVPLDEIDLSEIDWSKDLQALNAVYKNVYDIGIKPMISGNKFDYKNFALTTSTYTDNDIEKIGNALSDLCKVSSVKNNLSMIFSNLSVLLRNSGFDIFPSEKEAYKDIDWSKDIKSLVTSVLKIFRLCNLDLSYDLFSSNKNLQSSDNKITKAVKSVLKDKEKRKELNSLLTGTDGLFAASVLDTAKLGNLVNSVIQLVPALRPYTESANYQETLSKLNKDSSELRKETDIAFQIMDILFDQNRPLNYWDIKKISENKSVVLSYLNDDVCNELINIMELADNSPLFKSMYGSIMKTFVFQFYDNVNNKDRDYLFGLTPYDFNYDDENFLGDLKTLIGLAPKLKNLYDTLNNKSLTKFQQFESLDTATLRPFLNILANSELLNSDQVSSVTGQISYNKNVETVMKKLFSLNIFKNFNITLPDLSNVKKTKNDFDPYWGDGSKHTEGEPVNGEIDALCSLIEDLQKNKEFLKDLLDNRTNLNRQTLKVLLKDLNTSEERYALIDAVSDVFQSEIARPTAIEISLKMADKFLTNYNIPYSLSELRTYIYDKKNNSKIVEDINNIRNLIPLLNTINYHSLLNDYRALRDKNIPDQFYFQTLDLDTLNAILTTIVHTNTYQYLSDSNHNDKNYDGKQDILCTLFYALCEKFKIFDRNRIMIPDFSSQVLNPMTYGEAWSATTKKYTLNTVEKNNDGTKTYSTKDYELTETGAIMSGLQAFYLVQNSDISTLLKKHMPTYYPDGFLQSNGAENRYFNAKALSEDSYIRNLLYIYGPYVLEDAINYIGKIPNGARRLIDYINWELLIEKDEAGNYVFSSDDVIKEATTLFRFAKGVKKLGVRNLKSIVKSINKLSFEQLSTIQDMIRNVADSKLLTTVRKGYEISILSKSISTAAQYIIKEKPRSAVILKVVTLDDNTETYVKTLESMLKTIDAKGWKNECDIYSKLLGSIQGMNLTNRVDIYAEGRNYENGHMISTLVNKSELLHKAPIGAIKVGFRKANLNQYFKYDIDFYQHLTTSDKDVEYWQNIYDTALEMIYKDENFKKIVGHDITNLRNITIDNISTSFLYYLGKIDFMSSNRSYFVYNALVKTAGKENVDKLIRDSGNTPDGEDPKAYQIEKLFFSNEKLYKNNSFDKDLVLQDTSLIDNVLHTIVEKISKISSVTDMNSLYEALKNEDGTVDFFTKLTSATMTIDSNGTLVRSDLASELVAGIIQTMFNNESLAENFEALSHLDFYSNNYELVNPIEGKAIDSIIDFLHEERKTASAKFQTSIKIQETNVTINGTTVTVPETIVEDDVNIENWTYYTKKQILQLFYGLSYDDGNYSDPKIKALANLFKNQNQGNSIIAKTLAGEHHEEAIKTYHYDYKVPGYEDVVVPVVGTVGPFSFEYLGILPILTIHDEAEFLKDYIPSFATILENKSFKEIINSLPLSTIR